MGQGLQAASRAAAQRANISALDAIGTSREAFSTVLTPIEDAAAAFIQRVKANIDAAKMVVTGAISDLTINVVGSDRLQILGPLHLVFQDRGVNGTVEKRYNTPFSYTDKMPPWQVFADWIRERNLTNRNEAQYNRERQGSPFQNAEGQEGQIEKMARAMAYNVYKTGLRPRLVYSNEIDQLVKDIQNNAPEFLTEQIQQAFSTGQPLRINVNL